MAGPNTMYKPGDVIRGKTGLPVLVHYDDVTAFEFPHPPQELREEYGYPVVHPDRYNEYFDIVLNHMQARAAYRSRSELPEGATVVNDPDLLGALRAQAELEQ